MKSFLTPVRAAAILLFVPFLLFMGMLGYHLIEGWGFFESLYMAVITISTVGYKEVHTLSPRGQMFTVVLIFISLASIPILSALVTTYFFENTFVYLFRERRMRTQQQNLKDHVVICGMGRMGLELARRLEESGRPFVGLEKNLDTLDSIKTLHPNWLLLHGNATDADLLKEAGVERADTLVAALSSDADNLYLCLSAKEICPSLHLIGRAESTDGARHLSQIGVQHTVTPVEIGARRISNLILAPHLVEFMDNIASPHAQSVHIYTYLVQEGDRLCNQRLADLQIPQKTQMLVIAIEKAGGKMMFGPQAVHELGCGDRLFLSGPPENLRLFEEMAAG